MRIDEDYDNSLHYSFSRNTQHSHIRGNKMAGLIMRITRYSLIFLIKPPKTYMRKMKGPVSRPRVVR